MYPFSFRWKSPKKVLVIICSKTILKQWTSWLPIRGLCRARCGKTEGPSYPALSWSRRGSGRLRQGRSAWNRSRTRRTRTCSPLPSEAAPPPRSEKPQRLDLRELSDKKQNFTGLFMQTLKKWVSKLPSMQWCYRQWSWCSSRWSLSGTWKETEWRRSARRTWEPQAAWRW